MSTCQYYLRGHCRFGDRCRLSHNNSSQPQGPPPHSILKKHINRIYFLFIRLDPSYRPRHPRPVASNPSYRYVAPSMVSSIQQKHID